MFSVGVKDHIMIAHSLKGEAFGPAQRLHGATYAVSVELETAEVSELGIVVDIGILRDALRAVLSDLDYRNLDEHPAFAKARSTTELVARHIHRELGRRIGIEKGVLSVTLDESPVAWARYKAPIDEAAR